MTPFVPEACQTTLPVLRGSFDLSQVVVLILINFLPDQFISKDLWFLYSKSLSITRKLLIDCSMKNRLLSKKLSNPSRSRPDLPRACSYLGWRTKNPNSWSSDDVSRIRSSDGPIHTQLPSPWRRKPWNSNYRSPSLGRRAPSHFRRARNNRNEPRKNRIWMGAASNFWWSEFLIKKAINERSRRTWMGQKRQWNKKVLTPIVCSSNPLSLRVQNERMNLLKSALIEREKDIEDRNAQRIQDVKIKKTEQKNRLIAKIQRKKIKGLTYIYVYASDLLLLI